MKKLFSHFRLLLQNRWKFLQGYHAKTIAIVGQPNDPQTVTKLPLTGIWRTIKYCNIFRKILFTSFNDHICFILHIWHRNNIVVQHFSPRWRYYNFVLLSSIFSFHFSASPEVLEMTQLSYSYYVKWWIFCGIQSARHFICHFLFSKKCTCEH